MQIWISIILFSDLVSFRPLLPSQNRKRRLVVTHCIVYSWGTCTVGVLPYYVQYFKIAFAKLAKASSRPHICKTRTHWFMFLQTGVEERMSSCLCIIAPSINFKDDESSSCTSTLLYHRSIPLL